MEVASASTVVEKNIVKIAVVVPYVIHHIAPRDELTSNMKDTVYGVLCIPFPRSLLHETTKPRSAPSQNLYSKRFHPMTG